MILSPDFRERAYILEKYLFIVKNKRPLGLTAPLSNCL